MDQIIKCLDGFFKPPYGFFIVNAIKLMMEATYMNVDTLIEIYKVHEDRILRLNGMVGCLVHQCVCVCCVFVLIQHFKFNDGSIFYIVKLIIMNILDLYIAFQLQL